MNPVQLSKYLSYVLRHKPESVSIELDADGWVNVNALICQSAKYNHSFSFYELMDVVSNNDKKRFTIKDVKGETFIRAAQGHSTQSVAMKLDAAVPPITLYHGTAISFIGSIRKTGLLKMNRHHVHLSELVTTAVSVGRRHGKVNVLTIDSKAMYADGFKFFKSDNGVWLTDHVPAKYIKYES